jgi:ribosomal protein L40E
LVAKYSGKSSPMGCRICSTEMEHLGWFKFMVGAETIYRDLWNHVLPLEVYRCPKCLTVELRADEDSDVYEVIGKHREAIERNSAERKRELFTKQCIKCGQRIPLASEECKYCGATQPEWKDH